MRDSERSNTMTKLRDEIKKVFLEYGKSEFVQGADLQEHSYDALTHAKALNKALSAIEKLIERDYVHKENIKQFTFIGEKWKTVKAFDSNGALMVTITSENPRNIKDYITKEECEKCKVNIKQNT
jgi:hypothetical protein